MMPKTYFEDLEVGDTVESSVARTISESDVYTVAGLSGSYGQLHTDKEYMKNTEFGRRLVQNTLLIIIMEGLFKRVSWEPATIAAYGRDDLRFINPVFIHDTVDLEMEVVDKEPRENGGVVTFQQKLFKQDGELTVIGDYLLLVESRTDL
jgi:acyl dehydratase